MAPSRHVAFQDLRTDDLTGDLSAVREVLESGWLVLGSQVSRFEEAWAAKCGADYAIGVGNGLDAIEIGLRALGVGPGDEVITTNMTAAASVIGIIRSGATPVLADVTPGSALLDMQSVERCITSRTKAVLLVHLYGQMRHMTAWHELCQRNGLLLLEDCAQAHLASAEGKVSGSWGDFGAFSFYPTKNLGAAGDAGAIVTSSESVADSARRIRNYGQANRYLHTDEGLNSRLDEIQAAILHHRLQDLDETTARRQRIADLFRAHLDSPHVALLDPPLSRENHVYHLFVITSPAREALQTYMKQQGVETLIHYPIPMNRQPVFEGFRSDPSGLAISEMHSDTCLSLPCAPHMSDADVEHVINSVNSFHPKRMD